MLRDCSKKKFGLLFLQTWCVELKVVDTSNVILRTYIWKTPPYSGSCKG